MLEVTYLVQNLHKNNLLVTVKTMTQ